MCDKGPGRPGCGKVRILARFLEGHVHALAAAFLASPEFTRRLTETAEPGERDLMRRIEDDETELEQRVSRLAGRGSSQHFEQSLDTETRTL